VFLPRHFTETDHDVIAGLARAAGFGHLVVAGEGGLASTPMPFVVDVSDDGVLTSVRAHLARPNPVWQLAPCDALLIVPVTDAYISPGWYPSKPVDGKVVPTWNYEVVHLYGRLVAHDDGKWVSAQITELTEREEAAMPSPWAVGDASDEYIAKLQRGIVGVELVVTRVEAKRKLSQNKPRADVAGAIDGLRRHGADMIADAMDGTMRGA
jgi:transcriptional regulator